MSIRLHFETGLERVNEAVLAQLHQKVALEATLGTAVINSRRSAGSGNKTNHQEMFFH